MTIPSELISMVSALIAFGSLIFAVSRHSSDAAAETAKLDAKLGAISSGVDDLRVEMRTLRSQVSSMQARVTACETTLEALDHRVDKIEREVFTHE